MSKKCYKCCKKSILCRLGMSQIRIKTGEFKMDQNIYDNKNKQGTLSHGIANKLFKGLLEDI